MTNEEAVSLIRELIPVVEVQEYPFPQFKNQHCVMCIEDPFEININVTRTIEPSMLRRIG